MQVASGETIMIGGLGLNRESYLNSGFPWLRHVPGLNLLFARQTRGVTNQEVVVFITPHVWIPGSQAPVVSHKALGLATSDEKLTEAERLGQEPKKKQ
jgi:type II secretory pathway component GspD/PulD (secretin)